MISKSLFLIVLFYSVQIILCGSYEEETTVSRKEKEILDLFKVRVRPKIPKSSYINNYLDDDLYFLKWLRATNTSTLIEAEKLFLENLKWREEQNIDSIDQEEFPGLQQDFPFFMENYDKQQRPLSEVWVASWRLKSGIKAGKTDLIIRWFLRYLELESRRLYQQRAKGFHVAQAVALINLEGFSPEEVACEACISVLSKVTQVTESSYPFMFHSFHLLNMPQSYEKVLDAIKPLIRPSTDKALIRYPNQTKAVWGPIVDALIDPSQRSIKYGGTIDRSP